MRRQGHHVGIAPHEGDAPGAGRHLHDVAGEQDARAVRRAGPVQHRPAGKMAPGPDQGRRRGDFQRPAFPEPDMGGGAHDPVAVRRVQVDGRLEGGGPVLHGRVVVRVGDRDGAQSAQAVDQRLGRGVEQGDAVPQHVPGGGGEQEGALVDGEGRHGLQAEQAGLVAVPGVAVGPGQLVPRGPGLALRRDELPLVLADRAVLRWRGGRRIGGAAGFAQEDHPRFAPFPGCPWQAGAAPG